VITHELNAQSECVITAVDALSGNRGSEVLRLALAEFPL
jgi:hypothetical protein